VNYLKNGTLLPIYENDPNDIIVVYNALKTISENKTSVCEECVIDVEDCGAAYRFLMAVLAATQGKWLLTGVQRLLQRPILPLVNFLNNHGAHIQKTDLGWRIEGAELTIEDLDIDTSETSQYVSAIMMVKGESTKARKHEGRKNLTLLRSCALTLLENSPYIRMTQAIQPLTAKNAKILRKERKGFSPFLPSAFCFLPSAFDVTKLSDWSAAGFWMANALLNPGAHYLLKDLHFDGLQGDAKIAKWFKKWGLIFTEKEQGIEVKNGCAFMPFSLSPQTINVTNMPDMAMILAVLSVCYPFELTLQGLKNLNLKESNRLDILVKELSKFTIVEKLTEEVIHIHKRTQELPKVFHFDSYNDHRFVMAWSLFKNFGTVTIQNAECIKKSYPEFEKTKLASPLH
jgi:3-phosphoshikimate 1-carboxyvinyltransferase